MNGFYDYSNCVSGDFAVVRVKCRGNTVTNLNVYSDTDSSSLVFWGFGNGTVVKNSNIYNGITTINGMSENNIFTNYCCRNNIVLENVKHVGKCTETYDTSNLKYSGISMLIYKYQYNYALSASNRTIIPEKTFLYNITIKDCEYITSNFRTCLNLYMTNNKGEITYQDCKDPQYVYPTFLNDTIYITSASQLSAFSGFYGQSLIDKSQTISNLPVEYSWSDTLNDWTINTPWSNILGPVFNTTYISGTPQTADLVISAGVSQRVAIPQGTHTKFKFTGYGPFRYRLGTSASVALSTDIYADPGDVIVNEKLTNTHLAVYGVSYGNVYVEGGSI